MAWLMGVSGDCLCSGCWVEQAGMDQADEIKVLSHPLWVPRLWNCLVSSLTAGGSTSSWKGIGIWGFFYHSCFVWSIALLRYKAKGSYDHISVYGFGFALFRLLDLSHLSLRERLIALRQPFHFSTPSPSLSLSAAAFAWKLCSHSDVGLQNLAGLWRPSPAVG